MYNLITLINGIVMKLHQTNIAIRKTNQKQENLINSKTLTKLSAFH